MDKYKGFEVGNRVIIIIDDIHEGDKGIIKEIYPMGGTGGNEFKIKFEGGDELYYNFRDFELIKKSIKKTSADDTGAVDVMQGDDTAQSEEPIEGGDDMGDLGGEGGDMGGGAMGDELGGDMGGGEPQGMSNEDYENMFIERKPDLREFLDNETEIDFTHFT